MYWFGLKLDICVNLVIRYSHYPSFLVKKTLPNRAAKIQQPKIIMKRFLNTAEGKMHIDEENIVIMLHGNYQYFHWFISIFLIILDAGRFPVF